MSAVSVSYDLYLSYDHVETITGRKLQWRDGVKKILPDDIYSSYDHVEKIYPRTISMRARRSKWRHDVKKVLPDDLYFPRTL
jgi:hypothetical protein